MRDEGVYPTLPICNSLMTAYVKVGDPPVSSTAHVQNMGMYVLSRGTCCVMKIRGSSPLGPIRPGGVNRPMSLMLASAYLALWWYRR